MLDYGRQKPGPLAAACNCIRLCTATEKRLGALMSGVGKALAEKGCVNIEKGGLLYGHPRFVPNPADVEAVVQKLRAEMLEDGQITEEAIALVALLERSEQIKRYFSSYEDKQLKAKLKEIKASSEGTLVKQIVEHVDRIIASMVVVFSVL